MLWPAVWCNRSKTLLPCFVAKRRVSDYLYFQVPEALFPNVYYNGANNVNNRKKQSARLKVSLLKSSQYFGHFTSRVNRFYNEDNYSALVLKLPANHFNPNVQKLLLERYLSQDLLDNSADEQTLQTFNFNVFDGHGGDQISKYLAKHLASAVESFDQLLLTKETLEEIVAKYDEYFKPLPGKKNAKMGGIYWRRWLKNVNKNYGKIFRDNSKNLDDLYLRLLFSYLKLDYDILTSKELLSSDEKPSSNNDSVSAPKGGSTATSIFLYNVVSNSSNNLYFDDSSIAKLVVSHLGDTKCIIVDKFGAAHSLTSNHHPDSPIENMRLTKYSSDFFVNVDSFGEERFLNFANTRSFGDFNAKAKGITAEPEVSSLLIGNSSFIKKHPDSSEIIKQTVGGIGGDECFIILVSDGVTNYCSDQEMADLIMSNYNLKGAERGTPQNGAEELVRYVEAIGGEDNATCLAIRLNGWGKWPIIDRTGKMREEKLNDAISNRRRDRL